MVSRTNPPEALFADFSTEERTIKVFAMVAAVGMGLLASMGTASADPWRDESGHGRWGGKHRKHEGRGHGHGWGHGTTVCTSAATAVHAATATTPGITATGAPVTVATTGRTSGAH